MAVVAAVAAVVAAATAKILQLLLNSATAATTAVRQLIIPLSLRLPFGSKVFILVGKFVDFLKIFRYFLGNIY